MHTYKIILPVILSILGATLNIEATNSDERWPKLYIKAVASCGTIFCDSQQQILVERVLLNYSPKNLQRICFVCSVLQKLLTKHEILNKRSKDYSAILKILELKPRIITDQTNVINLIKEQLRNEIIENDQNQNLWQSPFNEKTVWVPHLTLIKKMNFDLIVGLVKMNFRVITPSQSEGLDGH